MLPFFGVKFKLLLRQQLDKFIKIIYNDAMKTKNDIQKKRRFDKLTFFWLLGLFSSIAALQTGIRIQKYNLARLGSLGIMITVPAFGSRAFLPTEEEIQAERRRSKKER